MGDVYVLSGSLLRDVLQIRAEWRDGFPKFRHPQRRRNTGAGGGFGDIDIAKLFQVESAATGPGIYNCLPIIIDSDEWDIIDKWDILDIVQEGDPPADVTETQQILNLDEQVSSTVWALFETFVAADWTEYLPNGKYYRCKVGHCAGGCDPWSADSWSIGDRCRYDRHAWKLSGSNKTVSDTDPPNVDSDWNLDDDEPEVGNNWTSYWELVDEHKLSAGAMIIAFKVTDDEGVTRLVGRQFGQNFMDQFFDVCT